MVASDDTQSEWSESDEAEPYMSELPHSQLMQEDIHSGFLQPGMFIAFRLDRKSFEEKIQPSPENQCMEALRSMHFNTYLGLVTDSRKQPGGSYEYDVHYISKDSPYERGAEHHYVPIAPVKHLFDSPYREALKTVPFFPYKYMFVWTSFGARITVAELHNSALSFSLLADGEELNRFKQLSKEDMVELHCPQDEMPDSANPVWRKDASFPDGEDFPAIAVEVFRNLRSTEPKLNPENFVEEFGKVQRYVSHIFRTVWHTHTHTLALGRVLTNSVWTNTTISLPLPSSHFLGMTATHVCSSTDQASLLFSQVDKS